MRAGRSKFIFQLWFSLAKTPDPVFYLVPLGQSFWAVNIHETTDTLLPLSHHVSPPKLYLLSTEYTNMGHSPVTAHAAACKSLSCGLSPYARLFT
jgi:hypothetical protein